MPFRCDQELVQHLARTKIADVAWRLRLVDRHDGIHTFVARAPSERDRLLRIAADAKGLDDDVRASTELNTRNIVLELEQRGSCQRDFVFEFAVFVSEGSLVVPKATSLDVNEVAELFARLHDTETLGLMRRAHGQEPVTILAAFQRLVDRLRSYLKYRNRDGLPQDMLVLTLADIGRVVRGFVVASEHYFLPHPRRCLCHGRAQQNLLLRNKYGLRLFGFESVRIGDSARDLARFAVASNLDENTENALLQAYLAHASCTDNRFVQRYFAHRVLALLERPVNRLLGLYRIKYEHVAVFGDVVEVLKSEMQLATEELAAALSLLHRFQGHGRPLAPRDVASMGRLMAYEEYLLREQMPLVGVEGAAYTGKTPVATDLAMRLRVPYVNVGALLRVALLQTHVDAHSDDAADAVLDFLEKGHVLFELAAEEPFYRLIVGNEDVTQKARAQRFYQQAKMLIGQDRVQTALRHLLANKLQSGGVVDGENVKSLLPASARCFTLVADEHVRLQRHKKHMAETSQDEVEVSISTAAFTDVDNVDTSMGTFHEVSLRILQQCLPTAQLDEIVVADFTGRMPLYEG